MVMYEPPYCAVCGGPFSHVDLLDFAELGEDDQYLKETAYDSQLLPAAQAEWTGNFRILAKIVQNGIFSARSQSSSEGICVSAEGKWQADEYWYEKAPSWADAAAGDGTGQLHTPFHKYLTIHGACMTLLQRYTLHRSKYKSPHLPTTLREFVDACIARQNECDNLHSRLQASGRGPLPGNWGDFQNVEHSHLYFGARRFWTDPWDCEPGFEHLCADPISDSGIEAFISTCLARPQSSRNYLSAPSSEHLQPLQEMASSGNTFTRLPREMLDLIISYLSLLDALSLYSTSRNLVMLSDSRFWRFQTIQLHGCWFWELRDHLESSSNDNWKALLQMLEINYFKIQQGAEPYWLSSTTVSENDGKTHGAARRRAEITLVPLPLGLANRQRIWMCLEGVGTKADWETKEDQPERSGRRNRRHRKSRLTG